MSFTRCFNGLVSELNQSVIEVFGFDTLDNFKYNTNKPKISSSIKSGIDWFDVELSLEYGNQKINLNELKSYDHSQKLVLMVNGIQLSASRRGGQDLKSYISQNPNLEDKFRTKLMEFIRKFLGKR